MPQKVLIIPDKFKGTLSAKGVAEAMAQGWRVVRPEDELELLPMSDGGDGFGELVGGLLGAEALGTKTVDAAHRPCVSKWWWDAKSSTAVVESAAVIGLAMLPPGKFHPFELDTFGLGHVLQQAAAHGARRCLVGIGGSATNDGAFGSARAVGWRFLDAEGHVIEDWTKLGSLVQVRPPRRKRLFQELNIAVDVQNPLLGPRGATRVYGPQKGLRPEDFELAEKCLQRLAKISKAACGEDYACAAGSGAAGGLGFGLTTFLGGRLCPGFDLFAKLAKLDERLRGCDYVLTGEGAIDSSTLMGKGVSRVAQKCRELGIPCLALAGMIMAKPAELEVFGAVRALIDFTTLEKAKTEPAFWLEQAAQALARSWVGHA